MPQGGIRMAENAAKAYGYEVDPMISEIFTKHRKTHNQGVFNAYTDEMRLARKSGIVTGLPDAYGRGRIIGDYRRVALKELKAMAQSYGLDISAPAINAKEAVQWLYFGYLAAIKQQNGAAMSLGRTSTFLDIYIERDLRNGVITEEEAQEIMDHFVMKLRLVKFLRTPEYNDLFSGDPTWVTESIGGMGLDGRTLVTKNSFRILNTLYTLGPSPEPNLTVLWSTRLPQGFKDYCSKVSIDTSSVQYENDDLMAPYWGDDYAIACGIAGLSVCADSLSAIKYAKVKPIRNEEGIAVDFEVEGDFPKYGNDDDRENHLLLVLTQCTEEMLQVH